MKQRMILLKQKTKTKNLKKNNFDIYNHAA